MHPCKGEIPIRQLHNVETHVWGRQLYWPDTPVKQINILDHLHPYKGGSFLQGQNLCLTNTPVRQIP